VVLAVHERAELARAKATFSVCMRHSCPAPQWTRVSWIGVRLVGSRWLRVVDVSKPVGLCGRLKRPVTTPAAQHRVKALGDGRVVSRARSRASSVVREHCILPVRVCSQLVQDSAKGVAFLGWRWVRELSPDVLCVAVSTCAHTCGSSL